MTGKYFMENISNFMFKIFQNRLPECPVFGITKVKLRHENRALNIFVIDKKKQSNVKMIGSAIYKGWLENN